MNKYSDIKGGWFCHEHKVFFKGDKCPKCTPPLNISDGTKKSSGVSSKNFTSNSQAITSNSQGVHDLKPRRKYERKVRDSLFERLHNYGVHFDAVVDWSALFKFDETFLRNNVSYKRVDTTDCIIKVFKKSILVTIRSKNDIKGLVVRESFKEAWDIIVRSIASLPKAIVVSVDVLSSVHNSFVNHPTAKVFREVFDRDMRVYDDDGSLLEMTDTSKGFNELEYPDKRFVLPLSEHREAYEKDLLVRPSYMPSEVKSRLDGFYNVLDDFKRDGLVPLTEQMKLHLGVEAKQDLNMDKMNIVLSKINDKLDNAQLGGGFESHAPYCSPSPHPENVGRDDFLNPRSFDSSLLTISKFDDDVTVKRKRLLYYKGCFGW
jgi:hypothetical protein